MKTYVGTKRIRARPMPRGEYNAFRGWQMPADEDPAEAGYLVEYLDGIGKPNVEGFDGYVSWTPADVFEFSYRELEVDNPPGRDTSAEIASVAGKLLHITELELAGALGDGRLPELVHAIRSVAASALGQKCSTAGG
jgi:hypothetical protein